MKKDLVITFLSEFIILISGLLVYKFAANLFGENVFSQYALCKRTVALILPALTIGLGVGIPRYIAFASSSSDYKHPDTYFIGGFTVLLVCAIFITLLLNLFKAQLSFLLFGDPEYKELIFPSNLMIVGLILHHICYSYYRGKLQMVKANTLQLINYGIIPVVVFIGQDDIIKILSFNGLFWIISSIIVFIFIAKKVEWTKSFSILPCIKELLNYGVRRVPGDFGLAAILSIPAIITAHVAGIEEAGYVAFGTSILNMAGAVFYPVGLIFLPKASQLISSKNMDKLKVYISRLGYTTIILTLSGLIIFEIFAEQIINIYLGKTLDELTIISRIVMIGCLSYTYYVSMRSILDAYYIRSVNTKNIIIALLSFLTVAFFIYVLNRNYMFIVITLVGALYVLGSLTFYDIFKLVRKTQEK